MRIKDFLSVKTVTSNLKATSKKDVVAELVDLLVDAGSVDRKMRSKLIDVLMARESLGSTAIGQGIAIPHGKCENVTQLHAALGVSKEGVNFDSLDGGPVYIFFLLVAPIDSAGPHLKALARISRLLKDKYYRDNLKRAKDAKDIMALLAQEDDTV